MYLGPRLPFQRRANFDVLDLEDMIPTPIGLAFPPDSELLATTNYFLLKLKETGLLQKMRTEWMPTKKEEAPPTTTVLGFENLVFPFICLTLGVLLSICTVLIEMLKSFLRISGL